MSSCTGYEIGYCFDNYSPALAKGATVTGTAAGPFTIQAGVNDTLKISIDDAAVQDTITLNPANTNAADVAADIQAKLDAAGYSGKITVVAEDGSIKFVTTQTGLSSFIQFWEVSNAAYTLLGLTVGITYGLNAEWGKALTADDVRYTFLGGIDLTLTDGREVADSQIECFIEAAMAEFERYFSMVIKKRIYRTNYTGEEPRSPEYGPSAYWTHIENPYRFIRRNWQNQGYILLNEHPIISVERVLLKTPTDGPLIVMTDWQRIDHDSGALHLYPKTEQVTYGPYLGSSGLILSHIDGDYADAFEIDYTAGYETSDFIPKDLRRQIGTLASIGLLNWIGDGLLAGFSSSSVSIDGLSESFSSTQSATSAYFGARILSYTKEVKEYVKANRHKFAGVPIAVA